MLLTIITETGWACLGLSSSQNFIEQVIDSDIKCFDEIQILTERRMKSINELPIINPEFTPEHKKALIDIFTNLTGRKIGCYPYWLDKSGMKQKNYFYRIIQLVNTGITTEQAYKEAYKNYKTINRNNPVTIIKETDYE